MKKLILVFILIQFIFSCSGRKNIPEITPNINADRIKEISLNSDLFAIIASENSILLPDLKGKLYSISDGNEKPVLIAEHKTGFRKKYFLDNGFLALFPAKKEKVFFYDLKKTGIIYESEKKFNIRGIGRSYFIHYKNNELNIINYPKGHTLFSKKIEKGKLIHSNVSEEETLLLFEKSILIYNIRNNTETGIDLKVKAVSPFLRISDNIYFGDDSRSLVKFSLKKRKIIWKYKFQKLLKIKPVCYKNLIVVSPEDNNTYLITQRGGVKDWYISQTGRLFAPVLMKDHLAVFLRTEDGTSISYFGLKNHSISKYKDKALSLKFPPVYHKSYLFSAGVEGNDPLLKLVKIGNKFGSTIKLEPEKGHEVGKAISFQIKPVNMYKPDITTEIYNDKGKTIFSRQIFFNNNPSFAWVPESGGKFTLKVTSKEKDGIETIDIRNLIVTDTGLMYKKLQMKLHKNCGDTGNGSKEKDEKKDQ